MIARHRNDFSTYLSDWFTCIQMMQKAGSAGNHRLIGSRPKPFRALWSNTYDLSLMLFHLDSKMNVLEKKPPLELDPKAYSECMVFLKASYIFYRILLDTLAAVIEYFYKKNERINLPHSFKNLLSQHKAGKLPKELSGVLKTSLSWFPEFKSRREDIVHHYQSFLILFGKDSNNNIKLEHSYIYGGMAGNANNLGNIREYLGFILTEYQKLIDGLLDHFDSKFMDWHGIVRGYKTRTDTILEGTSAYMVWWAATYGNYHHSDLIISE